MVTKPLGDVEEFTRLDVADRSKLARTIAAELGEGWGAEEPSEELDGLPLHHQPTGLSFVVVPGGSFDMGLTEKDLAELRAYQDEHEGGDPDVVGHIEENSADLRPVHRVQVLPFLVARDSLRVEDVERLSRGRFHGLYCYSLRWRDARELAASYGLRLVSEAEYEWLARDGGRYSFTLDAARKLQEIEGYSERLCSRFGLLNLFDDQWAEDDYHPTYEGAPATSIPWMNGMRTGVARALSRPELVDEPHQITGLLAALRSNETHGSACVRLARDLPAPA